MVLNEHDKSITRWLFTQYYKFIFKYLAAKTFKKYFCLFNYLQYIKIVMINIIIFFVWFLGVFPTMPVKV